MTRVPLVTVALAALLVALTALPRAQWTAASPPGRGAGRDRRHGRSDTQRQGRVFHGGRQSCDPHRHRRKVCPRRARHRASHRHEGRLCGRREVALQPGRVVADVRLARTAVLGGFAVTATGEPALSVVVRAEAPAPEGRSYSTVATGITDDRGEFRLSGLADGSRRRLSMVAIGPRTATVLFPAVESASDAEVFELKAGAEIARLTWRFPAATRPRPSSTVAGWCSPRCCSACRRRAIPLRRARARREHDRRRGRGRDGEVDATGTARSYFDAI